MSSAAAALHSDHVNLLVFRYLQEVGFENAATAFFTDWHRPAECRDPESYPFAHAVERNELVSVIQTGLYHDGLQSRLRKQERRFRWSGFDPRESVERRDGVVENGASSRPSSSHKRKGRTLAMRPPDEFPAPAAKRQRRSEGSEAHLNGDRDAMDVDAASADADAEEDQDAASPAIQSETEPVEFMERYDSMDVATQTEVKTGPKTSTMCWKVDKPGASILHSMWNPNLSSKNSATLLTVGTSICRFYQVPDSMDDPKPIQVIDEPALTPNATVTASAWRPDGRGASFAIDRLRELPQDDRTTSQIFVEHGREDGSLSFQLVQPALEPPGIILSVQYSPHGQHLLVASTNLSRGLVQVWQTPSMDADVSQTSLEPIAWQVFDSGLMDAVWTQENVFHVCGGGGLSSSYVLDEHQPETSAVAGSITNRGLYPLNPRIVDASYNWDKLRFDVPHGVGVFASIQARKLVITSGIPRYDDAMKTDKVEGNIEIDLPETLTALAFRPVERATDMTQNTEILPEGSLLAAAFMDGICLIYSIHKSSGAGVTCTELVSLALLEGPAAALAWSPGGDRLALGNAELVQIWTTESFQRKNGMRNVAEASVIWRPAAETNGLANGELEDTKPAAMEPSLSWSADGESLAFAADKQIAIIRFRPSLHADGDEVEINGGASP